MGGSSQRHSSSRGHGKSREVGAEGEKAVRRWTRETGGGVPESSRLRSRILDTPGLRAGTLAFVKGGGVLEWNAYLEAARRRNHSFPRPKQQLTLEGATSSHSSLL